MLICKQFSQLRAPRSSGGKSPQGTRSRAARHRMIVWDARHSCLFQELAPDNKAHPTGSTMPHTQDFCTIEEALSDLQAGRMIVLVDDEHRENEGDLIIAAQNATPEAINFMMRNGC